MVLKDRQFKESEIGLVPDDWDVVQLSTVGRFSKGQGIRKDEAMDGEIPCVRYGELYTKHSDYIKQYYSFITQETSQTSKKLRTGDILFAGSGETKEEIGKCAAFVDDIEAYAGGDIVILSPLDVEPLYLGYLLNAPIIQRQKASKGQGDAIVHISAHQLGSLQIPLPPTKSEQTAIVTALSDADALIENLEKLIEKKRNIKQGLMQELLTGRKRLAEFDGKWEEKRLGEIIKLQGGYAFKSEQFQDNNGIPIIRISNIDNNTIDLSDVVYYPEFDIPAEFVIKKDDVLIAMSGATTGKIGIYRFPFHSYQNQRVGKFVLKNEKANDLNFVSHLVNSENFKSSLQKEIAQGAQPNISSKQIESIVLNIPTDIKEQTTIANYLSDVESEIETLRNKTIKLRMIKQGMMQALLTGKIRLV